MSRVVISNNTILAQIYDFYAITELGANFLSSPDSNLQISVGHYDNRRNIPRHTHLPISRNLSYTEEVLIILHGNGILRIYDEEKKFLEAIEFMTGNIIHLLRGGHEFMFSSPTKMIEIKQGPYVSSEVDKLLW